MGLLFGSICIISENCLASGSGEVFDSIDLRLELWLQHSFYEFWRAAFRLRCRFCFCDVFEA